MRVPGTVQRRTLARAVPAALALLVGGVVVVPTAGAAAPASPAVPASTVYRKPVAAAFADPYPDPDVVRGKGGWWYAYGTSHRLRSGEATRQYIPISRSRALVHWQYMGDAVTASTLPSYADTAGEASLWAPDVHYAGNGQ